MKFPIFLPLKMEKNDSSCFSTPFLIPPEHQYIHLGHILSDSVRKGWYWASSLCLRGRHPEKQKRPKVANLQLHPSSILKHRSFTQFQHARCSFYIIAIECTCWFGRFIRFLSSRAAEAIKVQCGADIRHGTLETLTR